MSRPTPQRVEGLVLPPEMPDELRAVWEQAQDSGDLAVQGRALMQLFGVLCGHSLRAALPFGEEGAARLRRAGSVPPEEEFEALVDLARVLIDLSRPQDAFVYVERALKLAHAQPGAERLRLRAVLLRGGVRWGVGHLRGAAHDFGWIVREAQAPEFATLRVAALCNLANTFLELDRPEEVMAHVSAAASEMERLGSGSAETLDDDRRAYYQNSIVATQVWGHLSLAELRRKQGREAEARAALRELETLLPLWSAERSLDGARRAAAASHFHRLRGDLAQAGEAARQAVAEVRAAEWVDSHEPFLALARYHADQGEWPEAFAAFGEVLGLLRGDHDARRKQRLLCELAEFHERAGDPASAAQALRGALHYLRSVVEMVEQLEYASEPVSPDEDLNWRERLLSAERHSLHDALTGLLNRRGWEAAVLQWEWEGGAVAPRGLVALLDIDHFKRVNDEFSHGVGDAVLQEVAELLSRELPHAASLARYGGEEFALLLPLTPQSPERHGWAVLEACREAVAGHDWTELLGDQTVTLSCGYAPCTPGTLAQALKEADAHLYTAKRAGRNRTEPPPAHG